MTTTSSEPAGGLQTAPLGSRAQLTAAFHPARPNNKSGGLQNEIEAFDRARDPAEHEISFGPYRLLPARRLLLEGDKPVPIGGRALDLLIALRFCHIAGAKKDEVWLSSFVRHRLMNCGLDTPATRYWIHQSGYVIYGILRHLTLARVGR